MSAVSLRASFYLHDCRNDRVRKNSMGSVCITASFRGNLPSPGDNHLVLFIMAVCLYRYVTGHAKQRWLLSAHARTIPRFLGFSYFSQNKQIWAAEIDNLNFEGGLSFNRSSVSQVKGINIKTNSTWRQRSMFQVLYGIFSVDKALHVDT